LWDGFDGKCVKPCPILSPPAGGFISPPQCASQQSVSGAICLFTCLQNLTQQGPGFTTCLSNGTWTGERPRCQNTCFPLPMHLNAVLKPFSCTTVPAPLKQTCMLSCNAEYQINGNEIVVCLEDGNWNQPLGKCSRKCDKLINPANGQIEPKSCMDGNIYFGQDCSFTCEYGFVLQGSAVRLCLSNGTWSGSDTKCIIGCAPIGPGVNIEYSPSSCSNQLQVNSAVCRATCKKGMLTRNGLLSSKAICTREGKWNETSIRACYPTCTSPFVANGKVECFQQDGTPTDVYITSTTCKVKCDENYVVSSASESKCDLLNDSSPQWTPALANCNYQSDLMIIINRVQYEMVCLGVEKKRIVLVNWQQCKNESRNTLWSWYNEFQIQNSATGLCMDVSRVLSNVYLTSSECDYSNILQKWTCSNEDPYLVRLVAKPLYINTAIKEIYDVILTEEKQKYSMLYSYNPQSEGNYGTLCSRRSLQGKGDMCILPKLPEQAKFSRENCFPTNGVKIGSPCSVICNIGLIITIECLPDGLWKPDVDSLCKNQCQPYKGLKVNAKFLESNCNTSDIPFGTFCSLSCDDGFVLIGNSNSTVCTYGGRWTPMENYTCVVGCPEIGPVENGIINPNKCITGVCSLVCSAGFRVNGPRSKTCLSNGQWSGSNFSCIADIQFSIVSSLKYKLHSLCLEAMGNADVVKARCTGTRKIQRWRWNSQFTIENDITKKCLAVSLSHVRSFEYSEDVKSHNKGTFFRAEESPSDKLRIYDDTNNIIPIRLFNDGLRHVITKICDAMDFTQRWNCGSEKDLWLHLVGREVYLDAGIMFRSNLDVAKTTNKQSIKWLGRFYGRERSVCAYRKAGTCQALQDLPNGFVNYEVCKSNYVQSGTRCTYSCAEPFTLHGHKSTTCLTSGKWSNPPPTCLGKSSCNNLQPYSHVLIEPSHCYSGLVLEGQVCKIKCSTSTSMHGVSQVVCLAGGSWSKSVPLCNNTCPVIYPPALGRGVPEQCKINFYQSSSVCISQCVLNNTTIGALNRTCLVDGNWDGQQPICKHFCPPLGIIQDGKITPKICASDAVATGNVCNVKCNYGFSLTGKAKLTCIKGKWSAYLPHCK